MNIAVALRGHSIIGHFFYETNFPYHLCPKFQSPSTSPSGRKVRREMNDENNGYMLYVDTTRAGEKKVITSSDVMRRSLRKTMVLTASVVYRQVFTHLIATVTVPVLGS